MKSVSRALPLVVILSAGLSGCASLEQLSSGHVGCAPTDITISEEARSVAGHTWTAECNAERYYCSTHGGGEGTAPAVACAPASGNAPPIETDPTQAPVMDADADGGGCKYDNQCKLDRICEAGVCVDPPSPPAPEPPPEPEPAPEPESPAEPG